MKWACNRAERNDVVHSEWVRREKPCWLFFFGLLGCFGALEVQLSIT